MATLCPKCGHANLAGAAVCTECAASLANLCPSCGFENPSGFKYCGNCGVDQRTATHLQARDQNEPKQLTGHLPEHLVEEIKRQGRRIVGERRTVTVLFCDIVGFTTISEKLEPEQVYRIIDECVEAFRNEIYKQEGTLDKFMGDGVMAIFGAPIAHEDDPARAIRCALGMQAALHQINEGLAYPEIKLRMRVGLHVGNVVVGEVGADLHMNYTALGDCVNVAARLQALAEPGTIVASRALEDQTSNLFSFHQIGSIRVKGREEPVEVFQVLGARRDPARIRGLGDRSAPAVGREKETASLQKFAGDHLEQGRGSVVLITGDAGIGKSRLKNDFSQYLKARKVRSCEGACLAYGQPAYGVFRKLLGEYFGLGAEDSDAAKREKIGEITRTELGSGEASAYVLAFIEPLLSIPVVDEDLATRTRHLDPAQLRQQTFLAVRDLFTSHARREPLVLIFEDLQWADQLSLDLILFLANSVKTLPLWLLCTARAGEGPAALEIETSCKDRLGDQFAVIALQPLSEAQSSELVRQLLALPDLPRRLQNSIHQRAEGNPFYLEEIVRMLIERRIIRHEDDRRAVVDTELSSHEIPRTLEGLIMARVDNLTESSRQVLQCASVIGREFREELLCSVMEATRENIRTELQELMDQGLVLLRADPHEPRYSFRQSLSQQTVYSSMLLKRRENLHRKIAAAIESLYAGAADEHMEELAHHFLEANDAPRALPYLLQAGERAAARFANEQAMGYFGNALRIANEAGAAADQRVSIFSGLGNAQTFTGDYDGALVSFRSAFEIAHTAGLKGANFRRIPEIARRAGQVCERRGEIEDAIRWLETAMSSAKRVDGAGEPLERARIYLDIAWIFYRRHELEEAFQWRMRALQILDGTSYLVELGSAFNGLAALFVEECDWQRATNYAERGLVVRELIGDIEGIARSHSNLGVIAVYLGEWDQAISHFQDSLAIRQRIGQAKGLCNAYTNLGRVFMLKGESSAARDNIGTAHVLAESIHDPEQICLSLNALAETEILDQDWTAAAELLNASLQVASEIGSRDHLAQASRILAEVQLRKGAITQAEAWARRALQLAQEAGIRQTEASAFRVLGEAQRAQHCQKEAEASLSASIAIFDELRNSFEEARSQFQLAQLYEDQASEAQARYLLLQCHATFSRLGLQRYSRQAKEALSRVSTTLGANPD